MDTEPQETTLLARRHLQQIAADLPARIRQVQTGLRRLGVPEGEIAAVIARFDQAGAAVRETLRIDTTDQPPWQPGEDPPRRLGRGGQDPQHQWPEVDA